MDKEDFGYTSFLHLWQKENVDIDNQKTGKKLDSFRFNIAQLQYLKCFEKIDDAAVYSRTKELLHKYGKLVDSQDDNGLNNYAEPILTLVGNGKNESKKWKCSLVPDEIIKKYITTESVPSVLKEDMKVFAQRVNEKEKLPSTKKPFEADMENIIMEPSFDLIENDFEMFEEIPVTSKKKRAPPLANQTSNFNRNVFESHSSVPGQVPGRGVGRGGGHYPWNRVNAPNTGRGRSFADELSGFGSSYSGSFVESRDCSAKGKKFGGSSNAWNRKSEDFEGSSINQSNENYERPCFKTASHQLVLDQQKKQGYGKMSSSSYGSGKRSLGVRRTVNTKFVPPVRRAEEETNFGSELVRRCTPNNNGHQAGSSGGLPEDSPYAELLEDERLKNIEPKMVELIMNEIMDSGPPVSWNDIAGLELAKTTIQEIVVWPMLRPDIFTGLRGPPKGILLFGPPGTGKTMIGKCIACQSGSTFFSISASSLTSKWVGEGEKMVRAMFAVARCHQPSVIFIDEIDSLLTQRSDTEHESSRRIKTEFLVQLDGATSGNEERILVVGATNRPQELDEAARRRLVKRLYIPLPEAKARQQIVENLMVNQSHSLTEENILEICRQTDGYSGADMANLCREAALGPIRSISFSDIQHITVDQVRPISVEDFLSALRSIRASVSDKDLQMYEDWNTKYGISAR